MSSGHNVSTPGNARAHSAQGADSLVQEPKLLYAIQGVSAYHLQHGREESLTPTGPQTLSLLMVPTSSAYADPATLNPDNAAPQDFYLHMHLVRPAVCPNVHAHSKSR